MVCHELKGGIGSSSRTALTEDNYTVGVLVQANQGRRERLRINGFDIGRAIGKNLVPSPVSAGSQPGGGSIVVTIATDAPVLPHQCRRLAERAGLGVARTGGTGEHGSGDIFIAFSVASRGIPADYNGYTAPTTFPLTALHNQMLDPLFDAILEATEEAIVNALLSAATMTGRDGNTAYALNRDLLIMAGIASGPPAMQQQSPIESGGPDPT